MTRELLDLLDVDLPPIGPVTEESKQQGKEYAQRFRGSVRMALAKYWTDDEFERYRKQVLATPLP